MSIQSIHPVREENARLSVVHNDTTTFLAQRLAPAKVPDFENLKVAGTTGKISSVGSLDLDGAVFGLDEILKVVVEVRVSSVDHVVDETTGALTRLHRLKALSAVVVEWDLDLDAVRGKE